MTHQKQRLKRALQNWWVRAERARWKYGVLGRSDSDSSAVSNRQDYMWVRMDEGTLNEAYNAAGVDDRVGLPVRMRDDGGRLVIDGINTNGLLEGDSNAPGKVSSVNNIGPDSHQNVTLNLDDIADVSATAPDSGDVLQFNDFDNEWHNVAPSALGLTLDDLNGVTITSVAAGDILQYEAGEWKNSTTIPDNLAATIHAATSKATPVDADELPLVDSAASNVLKKLTWANLKATLKTYFDTLYTFANIVTDNSITNAKLRDSGALSVIGRNANSTGDPADISASAASDAVLRESGSALGFGTVATGGLANDAVTFAKMQNIATDSLIGRDTASTGDPENITLDSTMEMTGAGALRRAALTGDVTTSGNAATIANDAVTNAKAANMANSTIKGRTTAGTGDPEDLTAAQAAAIVNSNIDHGTETGLSDDDHTQYALLAGRSGGQTLNGDTASGGNLTLNSTAHATKGKINFGASSAYDGANLRLGIQVTDPDAPLTITTSDSTLANGVNQIRLRSQRTTINTSLALVGGIDAMSNDTQLTAPGTVVAAMQAVAEATHNSSQLDTAWRWLVTTTLTYFEAMRLTSGGQLAVGLTAVTASILGIKAGTSTNDAAVGGDLFIDSGTYANSGTGETDLAVYTGSVPANTLSTNGMSLEFEGWFTFASNGNVKTLRIYFGTDNWTVGSAASGASIHVRGFIVRTGAATQDVFIESSQSGVTISTATRTLSGAVALKFTGTGGASNDIKQEFMRVAWHDNNS